MRRCLPDIFFTMHEFVYFNERICRAENAFLQAVSPSALYGRGIFTTVAVTGAKPFLWEKHWRRLENHAERLEIDLSGFSSAETRKIFLEITAKNEVVDGRARLTFFDERANDLWKFNSLRRTSFLITTADSRQISDNFRLSVSPFPVNSKSPLAGVKSCNYLENLAALDEAKKRRFDEAVRSNERGEIVSACLANIFWLKNDKLFTPAPETGCLAGTTREFLMEKSDCFEIKENLEILNDADAIFLTSAGLGIVQVSEFAGRKFEKNFQNTGQLFA